MNERNYSKLRGFKAAASIYLIAGFVAIQAIAFSQPVMATWNKIITFPAADGAVVASWFFNPNVGIIGFHWNNVNTDAGCVKRTTDGGMTWTDCIVPTLISPAPQVTDIWFSDSLNGWLTLHISDPTDNDPVLWRSTDGGKTWTAVSSFKGIWACSVRMSQTTLAVTDEYSYGLQWSTDSGKTWPGTKNVLKAGLDFEDGLHGVASVGITGDNLYTYDGGLNWYTSVGPYTLRAWDVYAVKHGQTFVAAPEDTMYNGNWVYSKVFRSTDNGRDFSTHYTLPFRTNGAVRGVEGIIYVQNCGFTTSGAQGPAGLMRSEDSGQTWVSVGGPNEEDDIRFAVTGCGNVVYAFDDSGGVYKTIDAGNGQVPGQCEFVDNDTLAPLLTTICDTLNHLYYLHNINISTIVVEDLSIFDSTRSSKTGAVYFDSLPNDYESITPGDSLAFGLAWHPGAEIDSTGSDSVTIRVIYYASYLAQFPESGLIPYDTLYFKVKLTGESTLPEYTLSAKTIHTDTLIACNSVDTIVTVVNNGCDSLEITSATLLKGTWTLSVGSAVAPISLPYYLQSKDTLRFRLQETPVSEALVFDSLLVKMHYMGHDSSFGVGLRTNAKPGLSLTVPQALDFDSVATCVSSSQIITLPNVGCEPVTITQATGADQYYELVDTNGAPLPIPLTIPGDSSVRVMVKFIPATLGSKSAIIALHSQYFGYDSIHNISLTGIGSSSGTVDFPTTLNFNNVSICGSSDSSITISNKTCLKIFVDSIVAPAPFTSLDSAELPFAIDTGTSHSFGIRYKPEAKQTETVQVYLKLDINDGATPQWDTLTFSGTGVSGASQIQTVPPLTNTTLAFGTLSSCGSVDSISFKVFNPGCDTTIVTGLSLDAALSGTFQANANMPLPAQLSGNDTLIVTVAVTNLIANTYAGNLHVQYTLSDASTHDLPAPVSLSVITGGGASLLNMTTPQTFNFNTFNACYTTPDTAIVVKYSGCGIDTVNFNLAGTGFTFATGLDSTVYLNPGETGTIKAYYDGSATGALSSTVTLNSKAATDSSFSVQLIGNVQPPSSVIFNISFTKNPISAGGLFSVNVTPNQAVSGVGLNEIYGVLEAPANAFQYLGNAGSQLSLAPIKPYTIGSTEYYPFTITGNDISLDPANPIIALQLQAMVSDTEGGMISLDSLSLNGGDKTYGTCVLSANSNTPGLSTTILNQCGDSTLILTLQDKPLFSYQRLRPNPVTQESGYKTLLNLVSAEDGLADIELFDALGQLVSRGEISLTRGQPQDYTFDLHDLNSGSYYYSLLFNGQTAAGNLRGTLLLVK